MIRLLVENIPTRMLDSVYGHSAICTDRKRRSHLPSSCQDIHRYLRQPCCALPRSPSRCSPSLQDATACKSLTGLFSLICRIPAGTSRSSPGRPQAAHRATRRLFPSALQDFRRNLRLACRASGYSPSLQDSTAYKSLRGLF